MSYLIAGGTWFAGSLICGAWLVHYTAASERRGELLARTQEVAGILSPSVSDRAVMQQQLEEIHLLEREIVYAMVWKADGEVLAHTRPEVAGQFLDPGRWPALEAGQGSRVANVSAAEWADSHAKRETANVLEFTVPIGEGTKGAAFVSVAYARDGLGDPLYYVLAALFSAAGAGLIIGGGVLAQRRFERVRREIVQESRARTSLLTERGMLASVLAHEIRSPLTALRFNLHSLRQLLAAMPGEGSEKQTELTDRCEREIRRLDSMLTDFLHHTQVITGSGAEPTALNGVVQEAMEFLRPTLERSGIHVSLHLDPADPRVPVHPDELRQVILNLTANAQEAMQDLPGAAPRTLAISTISDENAEAPTATLLIRDSGKGIAPEARQRIFEPFFSTKPNGSGLGLTLVRRVISGAGGTVLYESSPEENVGGAGEGAGTTFRITLPRVGGV